MTLETHPNRRTEAGLRLAEKYCDAHTDEDGIGTEAVGIIRMLVSDVMAEAELNADYRDVFGRNPEPWRTPLGALRLTLADESGPPWQLERARAECEELVRVLNRAKA